MNKRNEMLSKISEEIFNTSPTHENYQKMFEARKKYESMSKLGKLVYGQEEAQELAAQQLQQKMSFDDFKRQLTVKDLSKEM